MPPVPQQHDLVAFTPSPERSASDSPIPGADPCAAGLLGAHQKKRSVGVVLSFVMLASQAAKACIDPRDVAAAEEMPPAADVEQPHPTDIEATLADEESAEAALPQDLVLLDAVFDFLPWRDVLRIRGTSSRWCKVARNHISFESLPRTGAPALFIRRPNTEHDALEAAFEQRLRCVHPGKWRCERCGFCNSETRILCGNRSCQMPADSHRDAARLFVGQLRREGTVPFLTWLVETIISRDDELRVINVENHRDLKTNRGKGCAWVYLQRTDTASRLLEFHHRVFADVHPRTGVEGVWLVPNGSQMALQDEIVERAYAKGRSQVLPRNALVVEAPARATGGRPRRVVHDVPPMAAAMPTDASDATAVPCDGSAPQSPTVSKRVHHPYAPLPGPMAHAPPPPAYHEVQHHTHHDNAGTYTHSPYAHGAPAYAHPPHEYRSVPHYGQQRGPRGHHHHGGYHHHHHQQYPPQYPPQYAHPPAGYGYDDGYNYASSW